MHTVRNFFYCFVAFMMMAATAIVWAEEGAAERPPIQLSQSYIDQLRAHVRAKEYRLLGQVLRDGIGVMISLPELKQLAVEEACLPLQNAVDAASAIARLKSSLGLTLGEIVEITLFIETGLPSCIEQKNYYLTAASAKLPRSLEYDPITGYRFIHLEMHNLDNLGEGTKKIVTKSILYDVTQPEVLARCQQLDDPKRKKSIKRELKMTQELRECAGIVRARAFTTHTEDGKKYNTIFCKLYEPGAFSKVLKNKSQQFNLQEQMSIAYNLLRGLEAMRKHQVVHKDLGAENYLLNIEEREGKPRKVEAVIADLGCATYEHLSWGRAQGHAAYTAPEGIFRNELRGADYYQTDLFAVGCLLYRLYYGERPLWQNLSLVRGKAPEKIRYKRMVAIIDIETKERRLELQRKQRKEKELSQKEEYEQLILRMVNPDPNKRGQAESLRKKMYRIQARDK